MMRPILPVAVLLLAASLAYGQQKVSPGDTPPAAEPIAQDKAAAEKERREAAKKALGALKGKQKDKGPRDDRKPDGR